MTAAAAQSQQPLKIQQFPRGNAKKGCHIMPIQKRTVSGVGKPAEPKQSSAEASPLKATPFAAQAAKR
jgi:hypothetical protein